MSSDKEMQAKLIITLKKFGLADKLRIYYWWDSSYQFPDDAVKVIINIEDEDDR